MAEVDLAAAPSRLAASTHQEVYFVDVCSFVFEFHSLLQLQTCLAYYDRKVHSNSRANAAGGDHWEFQRWFECLPLYLREEPKRLKVAQALRRALALFSKRSNSAAHSEPLKRRTLSQSSSRRPGGRER
jgi:hypothetical protein